jgi:CheY-like chemotaxis protein
MTAAPCVLIVDRNPRVRAFLARELEVLGVRALQARDRHQARELLARGGQPALLICDAEALAGGPGWATDLCPACPVVVQTYPGDGPEAGIVCAHALVEKTGDPSRLLSAVLTLLRADGFEAGVERMLTEAAGEGREGANEDDEKDQSFQEK